MATCLRNQYYAVNPMDWRLCFFFLPQDKTPGVSGVRWVLRRLEDAHEISAGYFCHFFFMQAPLKQAADEVW